MNINKYKIGWIALIVAIIAVLAITWNVGISPNIQKVKAAHAETAEVQKTNDQLQADIDILNTASANITLYKNRLAELQRGIPTSYDQSGFIAQLDGAASGAGVNIQSVSFGSAAAATLPGEASKQISGQRVVAVPVTISAKGGYDALRNFVDQVQRLNRIAVPSNVSYSVADDDAQSTVNITSTVLAILGSGASSSANSDALKNATSGVSR